MNSCCYSFKQRYLIVFSVLFLLASSVIAFAASHYYFDLSDEGLASYLSLFGSEVLSIQQYYYLTNLVGDCFGHNLLVYRYLFYGLIYAESAVVCVAIYLYFRSHFNQNALVFSLFVYPCIVGFQFTAVKFAVPSYDSYAALASYLWAASFLIYLSELKSKAKYIFLVLLLSVSLLIAFMAKASCGVALMLGSLVLFPLFKFVLKGKGSVGRGIVFVWFGLSLGSILYYFVVSSHLGHILETYSIVGSSGAFYLPKLLLRHVRDLFLLFAYVAAFTSVFIFAYYLLIHKGVAGNSNTKFKYLAIGLCFSLLFYFIFNSLRPFPEWFYQLEFYGFSVNKLFSPSIDAPKAKMITFLISFALSTIIYKLYFTASSPAEVKRDSIFLLVILFAALGASAGTSANLNFHMRNTAGLIAAPCVVLFFKMSMSDRVFKVIGCSLLVFGLLAVFHQYKNVYANYYRCPPLTENISSSNSSSFLAGVSLDENRSLLVEKIAGELTGRKFYFTRDRIYVYPAAPGLLAACGAKGYGPLWSTENTSEADCATFSMETDKFSGNVYILRGGYVFARTMDCFLSKLRPTEQFKSVDLGGYYNYRELKKLNYYFDGPYDFK